MGGNFEARMQTKPHWVPVWVVHASMAMRRGVNKVSIQAQLSNNRNWGGSQAVCKKCQLER